MLHMLIISSALDSIIPIFAYVGVAYGLMCISKACGLSKPWLSWIPFASSYQLGAVADHYSERVEHTSKSSRKILLTLSILTAIVSGVCLMIISVRALMLFYQLGIDIVNGLLNTDGLLEQLKHGLDSISPEVLIRFALLVLGLCLLILAVSVPYLVCYFIALNRVYKLMDPDHATLYTVLSVLSILLLNIATPIIFLILANKSPAYPPEDSFGSGNGGFDGDGSGTYYV